MAVESTNEISNCEFLYNQRNLYLYYVPGINNTLHTKPDFVNLISLYIRVYYYNNQRDEPVRPFDLDQYLVSFQEFVL